MCYYVLVCSCRCGPSGPFPQVVAVSASSLSPIPARVAAVLAVLRSGLVSLPASGCIAHFVVIVGQPAQLVSFSGAILQPSAWRLVGSVLGEGGWLVLEPAQPAASQPSLF
jgi:hypothetical protein